MAAELQPGFQLSAEPFRDRAHAGRLLAERLAERAAEPGLIVFALPRGGVPVAFEVARALSAPLEPFMVRKLGVPGREELALGALASEGIRVLNPEVVQAAGISPDELDRLTGAAREELERSARVYRGAALPRPVLGRPAVLVDDGLATGATMRAAVAALRQAGARRVMAAVPVGALVTCRRLEELADEVVCLLSPDPFVAVGRWYEDFGAVSETEVRRLLRAARR